MYERWKDIPGYEGLYKASSLGRIKALKKIRYFGKYSSNKREYPEVIMKFRLAGNGYLMVTICKDGKMKAGTVHRIIAKVFKKNPKNKKCINHKNRIKTDNRAVNLEWSTHKENTEHAIKELFYFSNGKPKKVINEKTGEIYNSISMAAKKNKIKLRSLYEQLSGTQKNKTNLKLL